MLFNCHQFVIWVKSDTNKEPLAIREVLKGMDFLDPTPLSKGRIMCLKITNELELPVAFTVSTRCKKNTKHIPALRVMTIAKDIESNPNYASCKLYITSPQCLLLSLFYKQANRFNFVKCRPWSLLEDLCQELITSSLSYNNLVQPQNFVILNFSLLHLYQQMVNGV